MELSSQQSATTASTVILKCALVALLLSSLISQCSATCRRQGVVHLIRHEGCNPRRVPAFACTGTCPSYSRVSPLDYTQMERSCQCCQESEHQVRLVRLNCPALYPNTRRLVEIKMAQSCNCRPCHGSSGVQTEVRLEDLLK